MIPGKQNLVEWMGYPQSFTTTVLILALIFALSPYLAGADFGIIRIPSFPPNARRVLRIVGPLVFLFCAVVLFFPFFDARSGEVVRGQGSPSPVVVVSPAVSPPEPDQSPSTTPSIPSPSRTTRPTNTPTPSPPPERAVDLVFDHLTLSRGEKGTGFPWHVCLIVGGQSATTEIHGYPTYLDLSMRVPQVTEGQGIKITMHVDKKAGKACTNEAEHYDNPTLIIKREGTQTFQRGDWSYTIRYHLEDRN
jgi:hypothetical protein